METNPFNISFGMEPLQYISRFSQTDKISRSFRSEAPTSMVHMISGVRGSGKTVMLSSLSEQFGKEKDWIVVNVVPESDIIQAIAAKLYSMRDLKKLFITAKLDFSAFGLGVSIEGGHQIFDIGMALEKMLEHIKRHGKRVLILIDEVISNQYVRAFSAEFQLLIRKKLPVFLIMTGLYNNIYNLQNEDTLTFLYRAPKIILEPLSLGAISRSYADVLNVAPETASYMARLTKGYPFAYQVLGYLYWQNYIEKKLKGTVDDLLGEYDNILEDYVYEKVWSELSDKEKEIIAFVSQKEPAKVADIRAALSITSGNMSVYRDRLAKKGVIDVSRYGYISLSLPRFGEIIRIWVE